MSPDNKKKLNILRKKLDLLDNKLIKLIKIRTNIVKEVLKLKTYKHEIVDKKRISKILNNIKDKSIKNKIDPGNAADEDLYKLPEAEVKKLPTVCGSLREALEAVDEDRAFLTEGGVFTDDQIDAYIDLKMEDVYDLEHSPHPIEYKNYFSV